MDEYQNYILSGSDNQSTSGSSCGTFGCGTLFWIALGIVFIVFWYANGGT